MFKKQEPKQKPQAVLDMQRQWVVNNILYNPTAVLSLRTENYHIVSTWGKANTLIEYNDAPCIFQGTDTINGVEYALFYYSAGDCIPYGAYLALEL